MRRIVLRNYHVRCGFRCRVRCTVFHFNFIDEIQVCHAARDIDNLFKLPFRISGREGYYGVDETEGVDGKAFEEVIV